MAAAPAAAADAPSETNLLKAVTEGALDVVKKMLDPGVSEDHKKFCLRDPVNCKDPTTGFPPLMLAAINGRATMCELLVRKKAALDCVDERGNSPLHRATIQNDLPVIEALVAQGMSVDLLSKSGLTPLHCAAIRGNIGVSELLLSLGAAPTVHESGFRSTPLHFAAMEGHTPLGRILINKGSSMNARTSSGDTPLHDAAGYGQAAFCKMLIRRGADSRARSNKGKRAFDYAQARGYPACVAHLEAAEAKLVAQDAAHDVPADDTVDKYQMVPAPIVPAPAAPASAPEVAATTVSGTADTPPEEMPPGIAKATPPTSAPSRRRSSADGGTPKSSPRTTRSPRTSPRLGSPSATRAAKE